MLNPPNSSAPTYQDITGGDFLVHKNPQTLRRMKSGTVRVPNSFTGFSNLQDPAGYPVTKIAERQYELLLAGDEYTCDGFLIQGPTIVGQTGGYVSQMSYPYLILDSEDQAQAVCNENQIPNDLNGVPFNIGRIKGTKPFIKWITNPQVAPIPAEIADLPLRWNPVLYTPWPGDHPGVLITNGARGFDGTQSFSKTDEEELKADQSFWISIWEYPTSYAAASGLVSKNYSLFHAITTGNLTFSVSSGLLDTGVAPTLNTWNHLFAVYDSEREKLHLYINGIKYSGPSGGQAVPSGADFIVGQTFVGSLCQLAFGKPAVPIGEVEEEILNLLWNNGNIFSLEDIPDPTLDIWGCRLTRWELDERSGNALPVEGTYQLTDINNVSEANGVSTQFAINSNADNIYFNQAKATVTNDLPEAILGYDTSSNWDRSVTGHIKGSSNIRDRWRWNSPNGSRIGINIDSVSGQNAIMKGFTDVDKSYRENVTVGTNIFYDGISNYSDTPVSPTLQGTLVINFYVPSGGLSGEIAIGSQNFSVERCYLGMSANKLAGGIGDQTFTTIVGTTDLTEGWHEGAISWDGSTVKLYLDGNEEYSAPQVGEANTIRNFAIGANRAGTTIGNFFDSNLNKVRVFNAAKIPSEFNSAIDLVASWDLGESPRTVTNAGDQSVNFLIAGDDNVECNGLIPKVSNDTQGSIMGWFKLTDHTATELQTLIAVSNNGSSTSTDLWVYIDPTTNILYATVAVENNRLWRTATNADAIVTGAWVHFAVIQDGVTPKIYINGTEVPVVFEVDVDRTAWMNNVFSAPTAPGDSIILGGYITLGSISLNMQGLETNWNYHSVPLTPTDIQNHYTGTEVPTNRTVSYPMDEGANNNGTLLPSAQENNSWVWNNVSTRWIWEGNGTSRYVQIESSLNGADYLYFWNNDKYETRNGVQYKNDIVEAFTPHFYDDGSVIQLGKSGASTFLSGQMRDFQIKGRFELILDDGPNLPGTLLPADGTQDNQWSTDAPPSQDWAWRGDGGTFHVDGLRTIGAVDYSYYWDDDLYQLDGGVQKVNGNPQSFTPHFYDDGSKVQLGKSGASAFLAGRMYQFNVPTLGLEYKLDEGASGQTVVDGSSVNRWLDFSNERNDIVAITPNQRPIWDNTEKGIKADGVDDAMRSVNKILLGTGGVCTAFIVGKRLTGGLTTAQNYIEHTIDSDAGPAYGPRIRVLSNAGGNLLEGGIGGTVKQSTNALDRKLLATLRWSSDAGGTLAFWDNGVRITPDVTGTRPLADDFLFVFSRNLTEMFLNGILMTIGLYDTALTDSDIDQLNSWLVNKHGII